MTRFSILLLAALLVAPASAQAPAFLIERIEIRGADRVSPGVIESESRLDAGRAYTEQDLREANDRLRRLPFVLDATFALEKGSERDRYVLAIDIREAKPLFYLLDTVLFSRVSDNNLESSNEAILGARFFAGSRSAFHFGVYASDPQRPITKSSTVFQGGYTRYDVLGTGALVTIAANQVLSPLATTRLLPEAIVAVPVSPNQTVTVSYTSTATTTERERVWESRWSYNTTNDPFFPTRGTLVSAGPIVSKVDGVIAGREAGSRVDIESRAVGIEVEVKRHWELGAATSLAAEVLIAGAQINQRRDGVQSDFAQGYGGPRLRLSRSLSTDRQSPSRLEATFRMFASGSDRFHAAPDGGMELSLSWARRNAWGALRLGAGYTW